MLDYRGADNRASEPTPAARVASILPRVGLSEVYQAALRHKALVILLALLGAIAGVALTKIMTPRYVATAQIYLDPRGLPGGDKEDELRQDSTGYINFVETQARLLTSQVVLDRVITAEKLATDPEFGAGAPGLMQRLFGRGATEEDDGVLAASRALARQVQVRRPERTFIIEISATSRSAAKAARIANAVAKAYIDTRAAMLGDAAQQATTSFSPRLEDLRNRLITAEKQVEDYKITNGLVGVRDQYIDEQSLKELNQQLNLTHAKVDEARARYEQVRRARDSDKELATLVATLNIATLTNLRGQQTTALDRVADLSSELGPKHPAVKTASARATEVRRLLDSELVRIGQSIRKDFEQARDLEEQLRADVDKLRTRAGDAAQASVKLRDLEREAEASRTVYESFLARARRAAEAQPFDPTSTHIITRATPPNARSFPPGAAIMAAGGMFAGLCCGLALAMWRDLRPREDKPSARPVDAGLRAASSTEIEQTRPEPVRARISELTQFEIRHESRRKGVIALGGLGIPVIAEGGSELDAVTQPLVALLSENAPRRIAIVGAPANDARTIVAVNLARSLSQSGVKTALIDADFNAGTLTAFIDDAFETLGNPEGYFETTGEGVVVGLPNRATRAAFDSSSSALIDDVSNDELGVDVVICDGAFEHLEEAIHWTILVLDDPMREAADTARLSPALAEKIVFVVHFAHPDPWDEMDSDLDLRAIA